MHGVTEQRGRGLRVRSLTSPKPGQQRAGARSDHLCARWAERGAGFANRARALAAARARSAYFRLPDGSLALLSRARIVRTLTASSADFSDSAVWTHEDAGVGYLCYCARYPQLYPLPTQTWP